MDNANCKVKNVGVDSHFAFFILHSSFCILHFAFFILHFHFCISLASESAGVQALAAPSASAAGKNANCKMDNANCKVKDVGIDSHFAFFILHFHFCISLASESAGVQALAAVRASRMDET